MRSTLPALACTLAAALLVAGCTAGPDFRTLAMQAPDLLKADMAPSGTLRTVTGHVTMTMEMDMDDSTMTMVMEMDSTHNLYKDDRYRLTMDADMTMEMNGETMDMSFTMVLECTPETITLRGEGIPMEPMEFENQAGTCDASGSPADMLGGMDSDVAAQVQEFLGQVGVPELEFKTVETAAGRDVAVYRTTMDLNQQGMAFDMDIESRANLDGKRITHIDMDGTGEMTVQGMVATMSFEGAMDLTYGARPAAPSSMA